MLEELANAVERNVARRGYRKTLTWPIAALAFMGAIGGFQNRQALAIAAAGLTILYLGSVVVMLLFARRSDRDRANQLHRAMLRYLARITKRQQEDPDFFTILEWREELLVEKHGDSTITRWITLKVGPDVLDTIWAVAYINKTDWWTVRRQESVGIEARTFDVAGAVGATLPTTLNWETTEQVRIFVHLPAAIDPGEELRVRFRITWPGYAKDLLDGAADDITWKLNRKVDVLRFAMSIKKSAGPDRELQMSPRPGCPAPTQTVAADGRDVAYTHQSPPQGREIGFTLQRRIGD